MGVDRAGNLWAWNAQSGAIEILSPGGERVARLQASGAQAVDVDSEWGVVGLLSPGLELQWLPSDGGPGARVRLSDRATDVCWIGQGMVALTPQTAAHRVEVWDLRKKALVRTLGEEIPLKPGFGATRLRGVLLRHDPERNLLYTLESFTGDLQVFSLEGKLLWRASLENPSRADIEAWLQRIGQTARETRDVQTPLLLDFRMSLASDGGVWVVSGRDETRKTVNLVKLTPEGNTARLLEGEECGSLTFVVWGNWIVFYRDPGAPIPSCNSVRRLQ